MSLKTTISSDDLKRTVNKLRALRGQINKRQFKNALRPGAKIIRDEAKKNVPISEKPHVGRNGKVYSPRNLHDSIIVKSFRRSEALFVGVKTKSAATASVFGNDVSSGDVDGYYAHWVEFNTRNRDGSTRPGFGFMRKAVASKKQDAIQAIVKAGEALINNVVKKLNVGR